jgi:mannitol-1-phosphate/altronate dehydrogenase
VQHIHFGAGSFGLGFVGWVSNRLGLDLYICNRAHPQTGVLSSENAVLERDLHYDVEYVTGSRETIRLAGFLNLNNEYHRNSLVKLLASPETRMLTTSLSTRQAYSLIAPIIVEGLIARSSITTSPLYALACENDISHSTFNEEIIHAVSRDNASTIDTMCAFIPCVVDRVCKRPLVEANRVVVRAERFGRLSLGPNVDLSFFRDRLSDTDRASQIVKIEPNFELAVMKKKWLLNGPHLLLAVYAIYQGRLAFHHFVRENPELVQEMLQEFALGIFYLAVESKNYTTNELETFDKELDDEIRAVQERFESEPDDACRVARRFVRPNAENPETMTAFFDNMRSKILAPALAFYRNEGQLPNRLSFTLFLLMELISDRQFRD